MERCGMLPNTEMDVCHEISPLRRDNFNEKKHLYHLPKKPLNWSAKIKIHKRQTLHEYFDDKFQMLLSA